MNRWFPSPVEDQNVSTPIWIGGSSSSRKPALRSERVEPGRHFENGRANEANRELALSGNWRDLLGQTFLIKSEQTQWNLEAYLKVRRWRAGRTVCIWQQTEAALGSRHAWSGEGRRRLLLQKVRQPKLHVLGNFSVDIWNAPLQSASSLVTLRNPKDEETSAVQQTRERALLEMLIGMRLKHTLKSLTSVTKLPYSQTLFQLARLFFLIVKFTRPFGGHLTRWCYFFGYWATN